MKGFLCFLIVPALLVMCTTTPAVVEEQPVPVNIAEPEPVVTYTPVEIDQETYDTTLADIKALIEHLNQMISRRNYDGWRAALSDEYFARISSREYLAQASQSPLLRARNVVLRSANDYFLQVVVPSRANSRVDEIEFEADDRVRAFFIETTTRGGQQETRRLRLYQLIKIDGTWKIAN